MGAAGSTCDSPLSAPVYYPKTSLPVRGLFSSNDQKKLGGAGNRQQPTGRQMADEWQTNGRQMAGRWQTNGRQMADKWQTNGRRMAKKVTGRMCQPAWRLCMPRRVVRPFGRPFGPPSGPGQAFGIETNDYLQKTSYTTICSLRGPPTRRVALGTPPSLLPVACSLLQLVSLAYCLLPVPHSPVSFPCHSPAIRLPSVCHPSACLQAVARL